MSLLSSVEVALMAKTWSPLDWSIYSGTEADKPDSTDSPGTYHIGSVSSVASRQAGWVTVNWGKLCCRHHASWCAFRKSELDKVEERRICAVDTQMYGHSYTHQLALKGITRVQTQVCPQFHAGHDNHLDQRWNELHTSCTYFYTEFICDSIRELNSVYS